MDTNIPSIQSWGSEARLQKLDITLRIADDNVPTNFLKLYWYTL